MKVYQLHAELEELIRRGYSQADLVGERKATIRTSDGINKSYRKLDGARTPFIENKTTVTIGLIFED